MEESLRRDSLLFDAVLIFFDGVSSILFELGMETDQPVGGSIHASFMFAWMAELVFQDATQMLEVFDRFSPGSACSTDVQAVTDGVRKLLQIFHADFLLQVKQIRTLNLGDLLHEGRATAKLKECIAPIIGVFNALQNFCKKFPAGSQASGRYAAIVQVDLVKYSDMANHIQEVINQERNAVHGLFWLNSRIFQFICRALDPAESVSQCFLTSTGDGAILQLASVDNAHRFAVRLHDQADAYNAARHIETTQFHFRVGIAWGPVMRGTVHAADGTLITELAAGFPLIQAVRSESGCPADGVVLTESAYLELSQDYQAFYASPINKLGKRTEVVRVCTWDRKPSVTSTPTKQDS